MINSQIINDRQNEDLLLKIQYASRNYFNSAEKLNYLIHQHGDTSVIRSFRIYNCMYF